MDEAYGEYMALDGPNEPSVRAWLTGGAYGGEQVPVPVMAETVVLCEVGEDGSRGQRWTYLRVTWNAAPEFMWEWMASRN